jgi:hypothetical protein
MSKTWRTTSRLTDRKVSGARRGCNTSMFPGQVSVRPAKLRSPL